MKMEFFKPKKSKNEGQNLVASSEKPLSINRKRFTLMVRLFGEKKQKKPLPGPLFLSESPERQFSLHINRGQYNFCGNQTLLREKRHFCAF